MNYNFPDYPKKLAMAVRDKKIKMDIREGIVSMIKDDGTLEELVLDRDLEPFLRVLALSQITDKTRLDQLKNDLEICIESVIVEDIKKEYASL